MPDALASLNELREIFVRIDGNGDGRISFEEFSGLLLELGDRRGGDVLRASFEHMDSDRNGHIDFEELRAWLCPKTDKRV